MTKASQFESAWRQLSKGDFTLLEEITDPSFQAKSQGMIVDLEAYKGISKSLSESIIIGPFRVIYEADEFLCVHRYSKFRNAEIFDASITAVSYKDQKIIFQESRREELDYDPSEGQDWNWEDYEWVLGIDYEIHMIRKQQIHNLKELYQDPVLRKAVFWIACLVAFSVRFAAGWLPELSVHPTY